MELSKIDTEVKIVRCAGINPSTYIPVRLFIDKMKEHQYNSNINLIK